MKWLKNRLLEPSTWLAIGIIAEAVAQMIETGGGIPILLGAIIGGIVKEHGSEDNPGNLKLKDVELNEPII